MKMIKKLKKKTYLQYVYLKALLNSSEKNIANIPFYFEKNIIIKNSKWIKQDILTFFGDLNHKLSKEEIPIIIDAKDIPDLLVKLKIYKSRGDCVKAGRRGKIPKGYTDKFKASKIKFLYIFNPS